MKTKSTRQVTEKNIHIALPLMSLLLIICTTMKAQDKGQVTFNGYTFNIPENWVGARQNDIYLMGSESEAGLLILVPAEFTDTSGVQAELDREQTDGSSISLRRTKPVETINGHAMGAEFRGIFNSEQATMYVAGITYKNSKGMLLYCGTTTQMYTDRYKELSRQIIESIRVTEAAQPASDRTPATHSNNDWEQFYGDTRLSYLESYYSSGYTDGAVSGGYSNKIVIDLCSKGYFRYNNNFNLSGGSDYSSFGQNNRQQGSGTWSIKPQNEHYATLILVFYNGKTEEYTMHYDEKGATYLNNNRFYRTTLKDVVEEHRPQCF